LLERFMPIMQGLVGAVVICLRVFVSDWWRAFVDNFWFGEVDKWLFVGRFLALSLHD